MHHFTHAFFNPLFDLLFLLRNGIILLSYKHFSNYWLELVKFNKIKVVWGLTANNGEIHTNTIEGVVQYNDYQTPNTDAPLN